MTDELRERLEKLREDVDRWWGNVNYYRDSMSQDGHNHEARKLLAEAVRVGVFSPAASEGVGEREADVYCIYCGQRVALNEHSLRLGAHLPCIGLHAGLWPRRTPLSHPAPEPERDCVASGCSKRAVPGTLPSMCEEHAEPTSLVYGPYFQEEE